MQIKLFTIPIQGIAEQNDELNRFLSANKIIDLEKQLVQNTNGTYWCFYISYISKNEDKSNTIPKIDYKQILPPNQFELFEQLRIIRKQIAHEDAISAFVVATNAEIAEIAQLQEITLSGLKKIKGFGEQKVEKYGKRILNGLKTIQNTDLSLKK